MAVSIERLNLLRDIPPIGVVRRGIVFEPLYR
jgi:hypothetical protein